MRWASLTALLALAACAHASDDEVVVGGALLGGCADGVGYAATAALLSALPVTQDAGPGDGGDDAALCGYCHGHGWRSEAGCFGLRFGCGAPPGDGG